MKARHSGSDLDDAFSHFELRTPQSDFASIGTTTEPFAVPLLEDDDVPDEDRSYRDSPPTAFRLLAALEDQGLVFRQEPTGTYRLGPAAIELGAGRAPMFGLRKFAERLGRQRWLIATPRDGIRFDGQSLDYQRRCPEQWQQWARQAEDPGARIVPDGPGPAVRRQVGCASVAKDQHGAPVAVLNDGAVQYELLSRLQ